MRAWWRKWKPWTSDFEGRAFWIGFDSIWDLSGQRTRRELDRLRRDRRMRRDELGAPVEGFVPYRAEGGGQ